MLQEITARIQGLLNDQQASQRIAAALISNSNNRHHHEVSYEDDDCLRQVSSFKYEIPFENQILRIYYREKQPCEVRALELTNWIWVARSTT